MSKGDLFEAFEEAARGLRLYGIRVRISQTHPEWKSTLNVHQLVEALRETVALARSELIPVTHERPLDVGVREIVTALYARAATQVEAAALLLEGGFSEEATGLIRFLYDVEDHMLFLFTLGDDAVKRYLAFDLYERVNNTIDLEGVEPRAALADIGAYAAKWELQVESEELVPALTELCEAIFGVGRPRTWTSSIPNKSKLLSSARKKYIPSQLSHRPGLEYAGTGDREITFGRIMSVQVHASPSPTMGRLRNGLRVGPTGQLTDACARMAHTMLWRIAVAYCRFIQDTSHRPTLWHEARVKIDEARFNGASREPLT